MLTSVHIAEIGKTGPVWRPPKSGKVAGLFRADGGVVARLQSSVRPQLDAGRVAMVGRWESESSLAAFLSTTPFGNGWTARCEPIRASGQWPGVEKDLPSERAPERDEPVIVIGQAKVNLTKSIEFSKFLAESAGAMSGSESLRWGCTYVGAPFYGSITMWRSTAEMVRWAYEMRAGFGNTTAPLEAEVDEVPERYRDIAAFGEGGHRGAITAMDHHKFFASWSYVRLRPLRLTGSVTGVNELTSRVFD